MTDQLSSKESGYLQSVEKKGKQQEKTAATRKALLAAAKAVFVRDGFAAARIEDISAEAGRSRGAFYANFKCKEDAFFALLEEELSEAERQVAAFVSGGKTLCERHELAKKFFADIICRSRDSILLRIEFKLYAIRRPQLHKRLAEAERKLKQRLNFEELGRLLAPEPGAPSPMPDEKTRTALEAMVDGMSLALSFDPDRISADYVRGSLARWYELLMREIRCPKCHSDKDKMSL